MRRFPAFLSRAVRLPERFRGGCAFGLGDQPRRLPRDESVCAGAGAGSQCGIRRPWEGRRPSGCRSPYDERSQRSWMSPLLVASLASGHTFPTGFRQDADNVGIVIVRHGVSTITHKSKSRALRDHQLECLVCTHLDRDRTSDPQVVGEHFRGERSDKVHELVKRIGLDVKPRNVARRNPDVRLWIPSGLNMKALFHTRIMRSGGRNGKPGPVQPYIRSGASMPSRSRASSSCFSVAAARARREAATLPSTSRKIGQAA